MDLREAFEIIRNTNVNNFNENALRMFHYQVNNNAVYREYLELTDKNISSISSYHEIPFLPVEFFKWHNINTLNATPAVHEIFQSSSTSGKNRSRHLVPYPELYRLSFNKGFAQFFGEPSQFCFLALLPGYNQEQNSSLIFMVNELIAQSPDNDSGFFLDDLESLYSILIKKISEGKKTIIIGVSHALLDFSLSYSLPPNELIFMETGGMKGRKKEMIRSELHRVLEGALGVKQIHSEYGMTELLSQAYSYGNGIYSCPPWMKVLVKRADDPYASPQKEQRGKLNIIDLANAFSCSFIETEDIGLVHEDETFEVFGRADFSEVRGCNVMV